MNIIIIYYFSNYLITGVLALCEVALGKVHDMSHSDHTLPKAMPGQCHSVRGIGRTVPRETNFVQM